MRILQVSPSDRGGGAEAIALQLFQGYRRRGHESWLAVGMKRHDDPDVLIIPNHAYRNPWARAWSRLGGVAASLEGSIRGAGVLQRSLRLGIGQPNRWLALRQGKEDREFPGTQALLNLPSAAPDVLHCHNLHASWLPDGGYFDLRMLPSLSRRVPVVLALHDAWLLSGHCAHSFDCERWQEGCGHCPDLTIYPAVRRDATAYNWGQKKGVLSSSRFFISTPSNWLMQRVSQSFVGTYAAGTRVIPNGVDLSVFCPADRAVARDVLDLPQRAKIILFAANDARTNMWKDFPTALEAVRLTAQGLNDDELIFLVLGDKGPVEGGGRAKVVCIPYVSDRQRLARYYQAADVYLHAGRVESWGLTITEAMACGTPVIATAIGGIPEQVDEGGSGFLIPPGDHRALAQKLTQLLFDDRLRRTMGAEGTRIARLRFGVEQQIDAYLKWYDEILDRVRNRENSSDSRPITFPKRFP